MNREKSQFIIYIFIAIFITFWTFNYIKIDIGQKNTHDTSRVDLSKLEFNESLLINLNGTWTKIDENGNESDCEFPKDLFDSYNENCSYKLDVILPDKRAFYTLIVPEMYKQYDVSINGEKIYSNILDNGQTKIPKEELIKFYAEKSNLELIITANSDMDFHRNIKSTISIGYPLAAQHRVYLQTLPLLAFIALFLLTFIYYLVLFINNRRNFEYLSFSLLCIIPLAKVFTINPALLYAYFPHITGNQFLIIDSITIPLTIIMLINHIDVLFPRYLNRKFGIAILFSMICYILAIIFLPTYLIKYLHPLYIIIAFSAFILMIFTCIDAFYDKKSNTLTNLFGIILIIIGILADDALFFSYRTVSAFFLVAFSAYILLQIEMFLRSHVNIYRSENTLSKSYSTAISQIKTEETNFLSAHLKAHFLFNALNIISGYSLFDTEKAKGITKALIVYLQQLFEHDNLNEMNSIYNEMELVKAFAYIELERFPGLSITYDVPDILPDVMIPSLTLQPLLENAINHGVRKKNSKGIGQVVLSIRPVRNYIYFSIKDDGAGQDEEILKKAIEENVDGKFHSLHHIQDRLHKLYNENITVRSISNIGTFISFKIPANQESE